MAYGQTRKRSERFLTVSDQHDTTQHTVSEGVNYESSYQPKRSKKHITPFPLTSASHSVGRVEGISLLDLLFLQILRRTLVKRVISPFWVDVDISCQK